MDNLFHNFEPPVLRTCPSILITVTWHDGHLDESDPWLLIRLNLLFQLNLQPVQFNCEFSQSWNLEIYISSSLVFWGKVGKVVPIEGGATATIPIKVNSSKGVGTWSCWPVYTLSFCVEDHSVLEIFCFLFVNLLH